MGRLTDATPDFSRSSASKSGSYRRSSSLLTSQCFPSSPPLKTSISRPNVPSFLNASYENICATYTMRLCVMIL